MITRNFVARHWRQGDFDVWMNHELGRVADYGLRSAYGDPGDFGLQAAANRLAEKSQEKFGLGPDPELLARLATELRCRREAIVAKSAVFEPAGEPARSAVASRWATAFRACGALAAGGALVGVLLNLDTREWASLAFGVTFLILATPLVWAGVKRAGRAVSAATPIVQAGCTRAILAFREWRLSIRVERELVRRSLMREFADRNMAILAAEYHHYKNLAIRARETT